MLVRRYSWILRFWKFFWSELRCLMGVNKKKIKEGNGVLFFVFMVVEMVDFGKSGGGSGAGVSDGGWI